MLKHDSLCQKKMVLLLCPQACILLSMRVGSHLHWDSANKLTEVRTALRFPCWHFWRKNCLSSAGARYSLLIISTLVLIVGLGRKLQKGPLWISPKTQDTVILSLYICCLYHLWHLCEIWTELNIIQKSYKNSKTTKTTTFFSSSSHVLQWDNLENCRSTGQTNGTVLFSVALGSAVTNLFPSKLNLLGWKLSSLECRGEVTIVYLLSMLRHSRKHGHTPLILATT